MAYQTLTGYTEVDPENYLVVSDISSSCVAMQRAFDTYLYKDFGANYFNALDIDFETIISSGSDDGAVCVPVAVTNTVNDVSGFASTDAFVYWNKAAGAPNYRLFLARGALADEKLYTAAANTLYYLTLERVGGSDAIQLRIYTDAPRATLLQTLSLGGFSTTQYRYLMVNNSYNDGGSQKFTGYTQKVDLNIATVAYTMEAVAVNYSLSNPSQNITKALNMVIQPANYTLSGINTAISRGYTMIVNAVNYVLTTLDAIFTADTKWDNIIKHTATMANQAKNIATMANISKNTATMANQSKNSASVTNTSKNTSSWTNISKS